MPIFQGSIRPNIFRNGAIGLAGLFILTVLAARAATADAELPGVERFRKNVQPILEANCYSCHGNGNKKGEVTLDGFKTPDAILNDPKLWLRVLKNVRGGIMPPAKSERLAPEEIVAIEHWIKQDAFGADAAEIDPGRVTLRRLNRAEYRNTIRDLMGVDFNTDTAFPADDTGYGFDVIGDVLNISPVLLEKYLAAAKTIVNEAVPSVTKVMGEKTLTGKQFRDTAGKVSSGPFNFYKEGATGLNFSIDRSGDYRIIVTINVKSAFEYDPGKLQVVYKLEGREIGKQELAWTNGKPFIFTTEQKWEPGEHHLSLEMHPLVSPDKIFKAPDANISKVQIQGPLDRSQWRHPPDYDRFFSKDEPPAADPERREYARDILTRFVTKAYRRPPDAKLIDKLVAIAETVYKQPEKTFEKGIGQAMSAVLASPRFLFRTEEAVPGDTSKFPLIDEYSLASRLSYFLWSTMPDDELMLLAQKGELRKNLSAQVRRMVADKRSETLVQNFAGQWLQLRDVDTIPINESVVLKRDGSTQSVSLDKELRLAIRLEAEMLFSRILHEDRGILELIDCDYSFLNERLAQHYGIPGVTGPKMRLVKLPEGSPRGGILTMSSMLMVTSNPTRTSPVKRGLFVLDNILGTPAPPPPDMVPQLEDAEKDFKDHEPTLRELMETHRAKPLCSACHTRMDPIGLGLENFNAMGMYRDNERGQAIDAGGKLITGEKFSDVRELKAILKTTRRLDFYRCLTEKLLTYALGRGPEYYDVTTMDAIVNKLDKEQGHFSILLNGIIESTPFQRRRAQANAVTAEAPPDIVQPQLQRKP